MKGKSEENFETERWKSSCSGGQDNRKVGSGQCGVQETSTLPTEATEMSVGPSPAIVGGEEKRNLQEDVWQGVGR
jgi:hypothetical protein